MNDAVLIALIAGTPSILTAILAIFNTFRTIRIKKTVNSTHERIEELEKNTNHKMDKLLETKKALRLSSNRAEYARGRSESGGPNNPPVDFSE